MTFHSLDSRALPAARWHDAVATIVIIAVVLAVGLAIPALSDWRWIAVLVAVGIAVLGACEIVVLEARAHRAFSYAMHEMAIEVRSGVLVRRRQHVPYRQILVVERRAGPIQRRFGIVGARLTLPDGVIDIPGIDETAFSAIRDAVETAHADR